MSKRYRLIGGVPHKLCTGPSHEDPEWLPATAKYYYIRKSGPHAGKPVARCHLCHQWNKLKSPGSHHGYVPVRDVRPFYIEATNRIGVMELSRRAGVSRTHIQGVLWLQVKYVQKRIVRKIMLELVSIQRKNEYSINNLAKVKRDSRNYNGLATCPGCGTPATNMTMGCQSCRNRHWKWYREGRITKEEFEALQARHAISQTHTKEW